MKKKISSPITNLYVKKLQLTFKHDTKNQTFMTNGEVATTTYDL